MRRKFVIDSKFLPSRLPFTGTIAWYLLMFHFNVSQLVWGMFGVVVGMWWLICLYKAYYVEVSANVDMWHADDDRPQEAPVNRYQERLEKAIKERELRKKLEKG